jgi:hypothetical protein
MEGTSGNEDAALKGSSLRKNHTPRPFKAFRWLSASEHSRLSTPFAAVESALWLFDSQRYVSRLAVRTEQHCDDPAGKNSRKLDGLEADVELVEMAGRDVLTAYDRGHPVVKDRA